MAKKSFRKNSDGLYEIKVKEPVTLGIIRFLRGRKYAVNDDILAGLGDKAEPADE